MLSIVVPIYDGAAALERCLTSLARYRPAQSEILLVNDASRDPSIAPMLERFARDEPAVRVITASANAGFIATANLGAVAATAGSDLLVLNADTEVTAGWADEMAAVLAADPAGAVCCPLSNNATYLSIPKYQQENELPPGLSADGMATLLRECSGETRSIAGPTPVGFCMLVRRSAWERFGPFDPAFGRGYGEDDDFGQKVQAAGHSVLCATRAFVYHRGGASFAGSAGLPELRRANASLLVERWPGYDVRTRAWCQANPLRPLHERIWEALIHNGARRPLHVLQVIDRWETTGTLRDDMLELFDSTRDFAIHTVVVPTPDRGAWLDAIDLEYSPGWRVVGLINLEARFARFLAASPAGLVHFHGAAAWLPAALVEEARRERAVLTTPAEGLEIERCVDMYRRAAERLGGPP